MFSKGFEEALEKDKILVDRARLFSEKGVTMSAAYKVSQGYLLDEDERFMLTLFTELKMREANEELQKHNQD